jgi:hypothetical protein
LTGIDPGHLGLDPMTANMRELSSDNGRIQIAGSRSGGGGCARVLGRRRAAALSSARPDLGFQRTIEHAVCTYAQLAMWRTYLGRRGRLGCEGDSAQCGGAVRRGGEAPASFHGRHGAWGQQQVAQVASSPPCASPGQLLDGETAATAGSNGGARVRVPAAAWVDGVAARVQIRGPRGWRRLK